MTLSLLNASTIATIAIKIAPTTSTVIAMSTNQPSEIERAATQQTYIFVGYVFLLLLTLVGTVILYRAGNKYQEAVKTDADARIEEAKREAAKALKDAAEANERAAKLEMEAAEAKLAYRTLQDRERKKTRRLTPEQAEKFNHFFRSRGVPKARLEIQYPANNNEAFNFAEDLYFEALKIRQWEVISPKPDDSQRPWFGARVEARHIGDETPALLLLYALKAADIESSGAAQNLNVPEGTVVLFVGQPFAMPLPE
jgi:hypothetical protein